MTRQTYNIRYNARFAAVVLALAITLLTDLPAAAAPLPSAETVNWEIISQIQNSVDPVAVRLPRNYEVELLQGDLRILQEVVARTLNLGSAKPEPANETLSKSAYS